MKLRKQWLVLEKYSNNMVGSVGFESALSEKWNGNMEEVSEELNPTSKGEKRFVAGKLNAYVRCLSITEPNVDDELTGDKDAYMTDVLAQYQKNLVERTSNQLGYPINHDYDYGALGQFQQYFSINNFGDPFMDSTYGVHSKQFEIGVLDWFARLLEIERDEYWGYVTSCGTEGNLHGILVGREVFPNGILYASEGSHYTVFRAARMYRMECVKVKTLLSGQIDCADFKSHLLANKGRPAIVNVNIGTTVKGAVDDLDLVIQTLEECGLSDDKFYIHCDGAIFGLMIPFVDCAPKISFKKPIASFSVSGHKFVGCPMPCGVQITRMKHIKALSSNVDYTAALSSNVDYTATRDATIMGSRNGHSPIYLWYTLNKKGYKGFNKEVQRCLSNAQYLKDRLREAGISAMLNELSSTVVFERPQDEEFIRRWQLVCLRNISQVVVMPHVTIDRLDGFVKELTQKRSTWYQDQKVHPPCLAADIGKGNCTCALCN